MKLSLETRYSIIFSFSLVVTVGSLIVSINKLQPLLFQQLFNSCTAVYQSLSANWLLISILLVIALVGLLVSLFLKLILSSYKTSLSLDNISSGLDTQFPSKLSKICTKLALTHDVFMITNHKKLLAFTAGLFSPKIVLSQSLISKLRPKELESVVLHELYHREHRHGLLYILAEAVAVSVSMLIPVLKDVVVNMKLDFENAADRQAMVYQGTSKYISSALTKVSGQTIPSPFPSFATVVNIRLQNLKQLKSQKQKLSKGKLAVSLGMIMVLSFFASMPLELFKSTVHADQSTSTNVCVSKFTAGMSKWQNSSSNLPASMF